MAKPPFTSVPAHFDVHFDDIDAAGAENRSDLATAADLISS